MNVAVIAQAIDYYGRFAEMLEVPYLVDADILAYTLPEGKEDRPLGHPNGKFYVASAEQSFLQMEKDGFEFSTDHPYMALTPCYRTEEELDDAHFNIFLKLEIIEFYPGASVKEYAETMRYFFWTYYKDFSFVFQFINIRKSFVIINVSSFHSFNHLWIIFIY